jgi:hypothetical protein
MTALRVQNARTMHTMTSSRSKSGKLAAKPGQIESSVSSATDDLRGPHRQDETRRTVDLGHPSDGPSWIDPAEIRVNTTDHGSRRLSIDCNKIRHKRPSSPGPLLTEADMAVATFSSK